MTLVGQWYLNPKEKSKRRLIVASQVFKNVLIATGALLFYSNISLMCILPPFNQDKQLFKNIIIPLLPLLLRLLQSELSRMAHNNEVVI